MGLKEKNQSPSFLTIIGKRDIHECMDLQSLLDITLVTTSSVILSRYKTEMQNICPVRVPTQQVTRQLEVTVKGQQDKMKDVRQKRKHCVIICFFPAPPGLCPSIRGSGGLGGLAQHTVYRTPRHQLHLCSVGFFTGAMHKMFQTRGSSKGGLKTSSIINGLATNNKLLVVSVMDGWQERSFTNSINSSLFFSWGQHRKEVVQISKIILFSFLCHPYMCTTNQASLYFLWKTNTGKSLASVGPAPTQRAFSLATRVLWRCGQLLKEGSSFILCLPVIWFSHLIQLSMHSATLTHSLCPHMQGPTGLSYTNLPLASIFWPTYSPV